MSRVPNDARFSLSTALRARLVFVALAVSCLAGCREQDPAPPASAPPPATVPVKPVDFDALYVVNAGNHAVAIVNLELEETVSVISLEKMAFPSSIALSPDRQQFAVLATGENPAARIAAHSSEGRAIIREDVSVPGSALVVCEARTGALIAARREPKLLRNVVYSPDGSELWVSQDGDPGHLLVLEPSTLRVWLRIEVGAEPGDVFFASDGKRLYVPSASTGELYVIDVRAKRVETKLEVGKGARSLWWPGDGLLYVSLDPKQELVSVDLAALTVRQRYRLGFVPASITLGPGGNLWMTDPSRDRIAIYMPGHDTLLSEVPGGPGAYALFFSPDGRTAWVSNPASGSITAVDVKKRIERQRIFVGVVPLNMVYRPNPAR